MKLRFEKSYPLIGGAAVGGIYAAVSRLGCPPASAKDLLAAMVTVSAISVGFLATAKAILISLDDRPIIRELKETGHYKHVVTYLLRAVHVSFALAVLSAIGLLFDWKQPKWWYGWLFAIWVGFAVVTALACYRVITIFGKVLRSR